MSRRGRTGPTISLFSFQDIITSVTAIVTVITLLLALDLVQRKESAGDDATQSLAAELAERAAAAEAELQAMKQATGQADRLLQEAATTSPAELKGQIAQRESAIADLNRKKLQLERNRAQLQAQVKAENVRNFDLEPLRQKRARVEAAAAELKRQREVERAEDRKVFSLPRGFNHDGWMAVVSGDHIQAAPLGRVARPVEFKSSGLPLVGSSAAAAMMTWINREQLRSAYFLILVRPDGAKSFDDLESRLTTASIRFGFDLIDAEQVILDPQKGAGQ